MTAAVQIEIYVRKSEYLIMGEFVTGACIGSFLALFLIFAAVFLAKNREKL